MLAFTPSLTFLILTRASVLLQHETSQLPALNAGEYPSTPQPEKHQTRLCTKSNVVGDSIPTEPRSKKKQGQELRGGRELGLELAKS